MLAAVKNWLGGLAGIWRPVGRAAGGGFGFAPAGADDAPASAADLLAAYEEVVYACVNQISQNVGSIDLKLCVATGPADPRPGHPTRSLPRSEQRRLAKAHAPARKAVGLDEIVSHPLLDLLDRPNDRQSGGELLTATSAILELCGQAFWYVARSPAGHPSQLWLLPTLTVTPEVDGRGTVTGFVQNKGSGSEEFLPADDVIWFRSFNPLDPYNAAGVSPVQSVWRRVMVGRREVQSWQAVLQNLAYPSALVYPPDGETFTPEQATRIGKEFQQRFGLGKVGGVWVVPDALKYQPVSTPPKDQAAFQVSDAIKTAVCNAYSVPRPLLDMQDANFASADTAKRYLQENCLQPRVKYLLSVVNRHLVGKLDSRLFLDAGELVMPDRQFELTRTTSLVSGNVITVNEARQAQGLEPRPGMDLLLVQIQPGAAAVPSSSAFPPGPVRALPAAGTKQLDMVAGQLAGVLGGLFDRLGRETLETVAGELDRKGVDVASKSWVDIGNWTDIIARTCSPFIRLAVTQGADAVVAQLGGDLSMRLAAIPKLEEAVTGASMAFARSTLDTTALQVQDAVTKTRQELKDGMSQGEANKRLADRIGQVFTALSQQRAYLIADTESNRARHAGELLMATEARDTQGIAVKKRWLCDSLACPECRVLNGQVRELEQPFTVKGVGPYARIDHPPCHPQCRCTVTYVTG